MPAQVTELEGLDTLRAEHQRKLASMVHIMGQDAKDRPLARDGIGSPVPCVRQFGRDRRPSIQKLYRRSFPGRFQPSHQLCGIVMMERESSAMRLPSSSVSHSLTCCSRSKLPGASRRATRPGVPGWRAPARQRSASCLQGARRVELGLKERWRAPGWYCTLPSPRICV
jgi:hypothetical protein